MPMPELIDLDKIAQRNAARCYRALRRMADDAFRKNDFKAAKTADAEADALSARWLDHHVRLEDVAKTLPACPELETASI